MIPRRTIQALCRSRAYARPIHTSSVLQKPESKVTTDTYEKEDIGVPDPSSDTVNSSKQIHKVDPTSDKVHAANGPVSGEWSRAGAQTDEYRHVEKPDGSPYTEPGGKGGRYGGMETYSNQKGKETSGSEEGPQAGSAGGRKPEGR